MNKSFRPRADSPSPGDFEVSMAMPRTHALREQSPWKLPCLALTSGHGLLSKVAGGDRPR